MFIGAVPKEVIAQILDTVPFGEWGRVYVGCSGSFRFDRAVKRRYPEALIYSNDVSLVTCSVGALAKGESFPIRFKGELEFVEHLMDGAAFFERVAAVWVAATMAKFRGDNPFARSHYKHYRERFGEFHTDACGKLRELVAEISIEAFYAGDFLHQASCNTAAASGSKPHRRFSVSGGPNTDAPAKPERKLATQITRFRLGQLDFLEGDANARFMEKDEFDRLVANIKRDGCLTSLPVVYRGKVYSGNHRGKAAIAAGIEEAECIEVLGWRTGEGALEDLSRDELLALQLSHNAISGKDDPNILAKLFTSIASLDLKAYSGLTDDAFKCDEETLAGMGIKRPKYEELSIVFLPEDREQFQAMVERIEKMKRQPTVFCGHLADFDALFDAIVTVKQKRNIINNAAALHEMARITLEALTLEENKRKIAALAGATDPHDTADVRPG